MSGSPDEFSIIADLFAPLSRTFPGSLGLTDDAAFLPPDGTNETVVTMDAMVATVHFLADDPADMIARKLVRVNLSDLAAKGATPFGVLMAVAFPSGVDLDWIRHFADGLRHDLESFQVSLIGGDTVSTPGPLTLSLTAMGKVAAGKAILRSGAQVGDEVWVSGTIGDGALGLKAAQKTLSGLTDGDQSFLADRYRLPRPRVSLGPRLVGLASAGMDVSDGLIQDLGHLCRASGIAAEIESARVPMSSAAHRAVDKDHSLLASILTGGDDYELLFTAPSSAQTQIQDVGRAVGIPVTPIGRIVEGQGVLVRDPSGQPLSFPSGGWRHFGGASDKAERGV